MTPGWRSTTLGQLARDGQGTIQTGPFGSQLHASDYVMSGIPTVMPVNIGDNRIIEDGIARITEQDAERLGRHRLRTGDIVYGRRGDVERRALVREREEGWLCGTGCLLVRVGSPDVDARYVSYWLDKPEIRGWIVQHAVGATMPNLNTGILAEVPIDLPGIDEQRGIAAALGALDEKIDCNRRITDGTEALLRAFAAKLESESRPVTLQSLVVTSKDVLRPSTLTGEVIDHFSLPAFDVDRLPERVRAETVLSNKLGLHGPSILVSRLNPRTPRVWFAVPEVSVKAAASTEFLALEPGDGVRLGGVWLAVQSASFQQGLRDRVTGTSGSHQRVRPTDALAVPVPDARAADPSLVRAADELLALMHQRRQESRRLARLRDALLPELLSGRIRVPEAR